MPGFQREERDGLIEMALRKSGQRDWNKQQPANVADLES